MTERPKLNPDQAARRTGVSVVTLKKWRCQRYGPPYGRIGRKVFYFEDDIDRWLDAQVQFPALSHGA